MSTRSEKSEKEGLRHNRQSRSLAAIAVVCLVGLAPVTRGEAAERYSFREPHLGTIVELTLYAPTETVAIDSARAAFARIRELNGILSDYSADSELMRLCARAGSGEPVPVSPDLWAVLERGVAYAEATDGAFDISIGPVVRLWRTARKSRQLPPPAELEAARQLVGWRQIQLDRQARTVLLKTSGMQLDVGGLAKGYIADQARATLTACGIRQCLVAIGGDLSLGDPPPDREFWRIGIAPLDDANGEPSRFLRLANCSVSTAGDAFQFVEIAGVRYSHIVDPRTGLGLRDRMSVTVVAPDGILADGLDTAVCLVGVERGLALIEKSRGSAALIVMATDTGRRVIESPGLGRWLAPD